MSGTGWRRRRTTGARTALRTGCFRVDASGSVKVDTFTGGELTPEPRRCVLCRCTATREVYGCAVCAYHVDHTEDDPQCPDCIAAFCPACEAWA